MSEAGGSAQREYERRKSRERAAIRSNLVWTVPLVLVLSVLAGFLAERYIGSMGWIAFAVSRWGLPRAPVLGNERTHRCLREGSGRRTTDR